MFSQPIMAVESYQANIFEVGMSTSFPVWHIRRASKCAPQSSSRGIVLPSGGVTLVFVVTKLTETVKSS